MNGATVAILGMLAACRGPAAAHRPAGRRQRHLLPRGAGRRRVRAAVRAAARPVRDGGVGHRHRRHRAVAAVPDAGARRGWARAPASSACSPRRLDPRLEVVALAAYGWVWGFLYGAIMNLWFWPFARGGALDWHPGLGLRRDAAPLLAVLRGHVARLGRRRRDHQRAPHPRDRPRAHAHPPPLRPPPRPRRRVRRHPPTCSPEPRPQQRHNVTHPLGVAPLGLRTPKRRRHYGVEVVISRGRTCGSAQYCVQVRQLPCTSRALATGDATSVQGGWRRARRRTPGARRGRRGW